MRSRDGIPETALQFLTRRLARKRSLEYPPLLEPNRSSSSCGLFPSRSDASVDAAPNTPAFITLFGCVLADGEDWAVITEHDGCGSLGFMFAEPEVVGCGV